jgi:hypothetical protein
MEINNKYQVGKTYYYYAFGQIKKLLVIRLEFINRLDSSGNLCSSISYSGRFLGKNQSPIPFTFKEKELLFENKEDCLKYAMNNLLEQ